MSDLLVEAFDRTGSDVKPSQVTGFMEVQCAFTAYPFVLVINGEGGDLRSVEPAKRVARAFPPLP